MMSEIQRYDTDGLGVLYADSSGPYVLNSDHLADKAAAVKKLEEENKTLREALECVMRSKELVLPGSGCLVKAEHAEEVRALSEMYSVVKQALEKK